MAVGGLSNALLTYSMSSPSLRPQVRYTGKLTADATMPLGTALVSSPAVFTGVSVARWGDYSAVSIEPLDQMKGWVVNQYAGGTSQNQWRTRISKIGQ